MMKQLVALLKGRSETSDQVASKIADLEQLEQDETERITSLRTAHGEALINGNAGGKIEQELEAARLEHVRITAALEALRTQYTQLARAESEARAVADLKAAVKAVAALPTLLGKYAKTAVPVVDALRTMRRMSDGAIALPRSASQSGVTGTLGTAKALWREARIPEPGRIAHHLWPSDDPNAPVTVHGGGNPHREGDWPAGLDDAGTRATDALAAYERTAPALRTVVADIRDRNNSILNARRDAVAAGLDVPNAVADHKTLQAFLNGIVIPDVPDNAPRIELFAFSRRQVFSAGVEV